MSDEGMLYRVASELDAAGQSRLSYALLEVLNRRVELEQQRKKLCDEVCSAVWHLERDQRDDAYNILMKTLKRHWGVVSVE